MPEQLRSLLQWAGTKRKSQQALEIRMRWPKEIPLSVVRQTVFEAKRSEETLFISAQSGLKVTTKCRRVCISLSGTVRFIRMPNVLYETNVTRSAFVLLFCVFF